MNAVYGAMFTRRGLESTPKRGKKSESPERALGATKSFDASALALVGSEASDDDTNANETFYRI